MSDSDERTSPPQAPSSKPHFNPIAYGTMPSTSSSPHDSAIAIPISPADLPFSAPPLRYTYSHPNGHRIIPPSISGHGRLIVARRTISYWAGVLVVVGSFAWAVFVAMHIFQLLGSKHERTRPDYGRGDCEGWFC